LGLGGEFLVETKALLDRGDARERGIDFFWRIPRYLRPIPPAARRGGESWSGERIRGRRNIQASRTAQPNKKRFTLRRVLGAADLRVTEFTLTYGDSPACDYRVYACVSGRWLTSQDRVSARSLENSGNKQIARMSASKCGGD
jgi:hypothetical protein